MLIRDVVATPPPPHICLPEQVRFSSLLMLMELTSKLKENYMVLLPETIPFLAELMEGEHTDLPAVIFALPYKVKEPTIRFKHPVIQRHDDFWRQCGP